MEEKDEQLSSQIEQPRRQLMTSTMISLEGGRVPRMPNKKEVLPRDSLGSSVDYESLSEAGILEPRALCAALLSHWEKRAVGINTIGVAAVRYLLVLAEDVSGDERPETATARCTFSSMVKHGCTDVWRSECHTHGLRTT